MPNFPYPSVDSEFIIKKLLESNKVNRKTYLVVGNTHIVNYKGNKPVYKKQIVVRVIDGEVNYMQATGLAAIHGFMHELLNWFEKEKNWKDGAYIEKEN